MYIRQKTESASYPLNSGGFGKSCPSSMHAAGRWLLLVLSLLPLVCPPSAGAQGASADRMVLTDNIKPVFDGPVPATSVSKGVVVRPTLTAAEAAEPMKISVTLNMRNYAELQRRVAAQDVIPAAEMAARYLPLESDFLVLSQWLSSQGLRVQPGGAGHAVAFAWGTPSQLQQAFQTSFGRVVFRGGEYTAITAAPSVPAAIAPMVASVHGLQPYLHPRKRPQVITPASANQPPFLINEILKAYGAANTGYTGAGQEICILIDSFPLDSDLTQFWTANGVNQKLSNIIKVDVSDGTGTLEPSGEETLDVSWSSGIASDAQVLIYAAGDLNNIGAAYSRLLDDLQSGAVPNLHQVSMSYGAGEQSDEDAADLNATSQLFTAISAYGVTLFASSGDNGAYGAVGRNTEVSYPASDPNVVGVGGTSLFLNAQTGSASAESAWSPDGSTDEYGRIGASGGGVSQFFARPAYQKGGSLPAGTTRLVPDVSLAADPNTGCYLVLNGDVSQYGGTSWSSPTWAGLCALLNQARANNNTKPIGLLNSALYTTAGMAAFRDIVSGNNAVYQAGAGYDLVTGLGVPRISSLLPVVLATNPAPVILSPATASGQVGVAFSYQIAATNVPNLFAASGLPAGLSLNATTGLITGTPTATGNFTANLAAANSGGTGTLTLTLIINAANVAAPAITAFTPNNGPTGTVVTLAGTNFAAVTSVSFNGTPATFTASATSITATVPAAAASGVITVTSPTGTAATAANFFVTVAGQAPVVTSAASATAQVGTSFAYQVAAANAPGNFGAQGLPAGLTIDPNTGRISGTPTSQGSYQATLTATNSAGTGIGVVVLTVLPLPPVITAAAMQPASVGVLFTFQIVATNSPTMFTAAGLPDGLTVGAATGLIAGTPTTVGTYTVALTASNAGGTGTAALTITVTLPAPTITSATTATTRTGTAFTYQITATAYPTSFGAFGLPAGLNFNPAAGVISGTPTASGTFAVSLAATNATGTASGMLSLTVLPPPPVISGAATANAQVGETFSYQIVASNAPTAYGGNGLPDGLRVDPSTGLIYGAPNTPGTFQVTLSAVNVSGAATATLTLTVKIARPVITSSLTANSLQGQPFSYQIAATGGATSFGAAGLPAGLTVNAATGLISGTLTVPGTFGVTLMATNEGGTGTAILQLSITPLAPVITGTLTATVQVNDLFTYQVATANAPTLYTATGLPAGVGINQATGLLNGTPLAAGTYSIGLTVSNQSGTTSAVLVLVVTARPPTLTATATVPQIDSVNGEAGVITITRSGNDRSKPVTLTYKVKGSARPGVDYVALTGTATIKAGKAFVRVKVVSLGGNLGGESQRVAKVVLAAPADGSYTVGNIKGAKVRIVVP